MIRTAILAVDPKLVLSNRLVVMTFLSGLQSMLAVQSAHLASHAVLDTRIFCPRYMKRKRQSLRELRQQHRPTFFQHL